MKLINKQMAGQKLAVKGGNLQIDDHGCVEVTEKDLIKSLKSFAGFKEWSPALEKKSSTSNREDKPLDPSISPVDDELSDEDEDEDVDEQEENKEQKPSQEQVPAQGQKRGWNPSKNK